MKSHLIAIFATVFFLTVASVSIVCSGQSLDTEGSVTDELGNQIDDSSAASLFVDGLRIGNSSDGITT